MGYKQFEFAYSATCTGESSGQQERVCWRSTQKLALQKFQ